MATPTLSRERPHARDNLRHQAERRRARAKYLWMALAAFVLLAGVVAYFSTRTSTPKTAAGIQQARPVQITGTALPELQSGTDAAVGLTIPEVSGASFDGSPVRIANDGRSKLILFVAHWCPHCQNEVPKIVEHLAAKALPATVDLITVSTSASSAKPNYPPSEWLAIENWTWPVMVDSEKGEAALAYGLSAFPYFVAADASGKVVARSSGEITMDQFDAMLQKATTPNAG